MRFDQRARRAAQGIDRAVEVMEMSSTKTPQRPARFDQYRERKSRNQRIAAFAVGIAVPVVLLISLVLVMRSDGDPNVPATAPSESVSPSGISGPESHTVTVIGDPALNGSYVITMKLLDGYGGDDVVFGSDGGQGISIWAVGNVFANPCHSNDTLLDPPIDSSVDGLVAGLASQKGHPATTPTDVEVDGYAGKYMEMKVPAGIDVADCDHGRFRTWISPDGGARYVEQPGQRDMLWIVDVDGSRLVIDAALGPDTTQRDRADRIQMVESINIEPV